MIKSRKEFVGGKKEEIKQKVSLLVDLFSLSIFEQDLESVKIFGNMENFTIFSLFEDKVKGLEEISKVLDKLETDDKIETKWKLMISKRNKLSCSVTIKRHEYLRGIVTVELS